MAALDGTIKMTTAEYRPCYVYGKKALFHRWIDKSEIIAPSIMKGGHAGGVIRGTCGIVEFENGVICEVYPYKIKFADNKIKEYAFNEGSGTDEKMD